MHLSALVNVLAQDPDVQSLVEAAQNSHDLNITLSPGVRLPVVAHLAGKQHAPIIVVTATGREAHEVAAGLESFLPPSQIATFPAWETLPHERLSPRADTVAHRLATLRRLAHPEEEPLRVVTMPVRSLVQPIPTGLADVKPVRVRMGDRMEIETLVQGLIDAAYTRADMVTRRGEFAVRGGIVDVFAPTEAHPHRIEFFGDEVDEIRFFSAADQRSLEIADDGVWAPACREVLLTDEVRSRAAELASQLPGAQEMLESLAQGVPVEGMESLAPALVGSMELVTSHFPTDSLVVLVEPERLVARAHDLVATTEEFLAAAWSTAAAGGQAPLDLTEVEKLGLSQASFVTLDDVHAQAQQAGLRWWSFGSLPTDSDFDSSTVTIHTTDVRAYRGKINEAIDDLKDLTRNGWQLLLVTEGPGPAKRLADQLSSYEVPARFVTDLAELEPGVVMVTTAQIRQGFVSQSLELAVFTESDLTGRESPTTQDRRTLPSRRRGVVDPLELKTGDYVVHEQHGVGRFVELISRTVGAGPQAATREYLVIEYAPSKRGQPGDRLFVPTDSLDQVTKYTGGEAPSVNKMGGGDWAKTKAKARKAVREIAAELIRLYAARTATVGHTFSPDTPWQAELEDAFAHVETPDQLVTIDEVKADMEKPVPMDRLVLGDVGYGKTEIAVRAAFKAVQDGKQVAVLVPTTLLVQQHLETFTERYAQFPVTVKALSRFQTPKETETIRQEVTQGKVDVLIGTHRILTGDVRFKDLGLVIIDEEQRFGVEHKETLKQMRTNVDVLSMSATPIPRTLEMAVTGIREMSTLATPPEERHPVLTYVGPYSDKQIAAAIRRELLRDGQVFYVHNRVESISRVASRLSELVPDARIGVAHGQMNEAQLEQVILDFWQREYDVLVSTTIVESGLDISNANTLIVERAEVFGLSQLHQLRGRVGRGRERAYAYFFYPPEKPLTDTAYDRLRTIAANTDLGAGTAVAMKDLEIRGAGNLLGGEQSGHIAGVGFDLYVRMVSEAVADFRGEGSQELPELKVELPIDAHIPHDYIAEERLRLEAYAKIAAAENDEQVDDIEAELTDRYGPPPQAVKRLFLVANLRTRARGLGLADITSQGKFIRFAPVELAQSAQLRLRRLYPGSVVKPAIRTVLVPAPMTSKVGGKPIRDEALVEWVNNVLEAVLGQSVSAAAQVATGQ